MTHENATGSDGGKKRMAEKKAGKKDGEAHEQTYIDHK